jgi:hypothetical protein
MDALIQAGKELIQYLFGRWTGPKLEVDFDPLKEPNESIVEDANNQKGWFYRLNVHNKGHNTADECEGILSTAEPIEGGRALERPSILKWAHEDSFRHVSIEPGETRKLDLFFVLEGDLRLHFFIDMPRIPVGFERSFESKSYKVKVRVKARGGANAVASFKVEPRANHRKFRITKF